MKKYTILLATLPFLAGCATYLDYSNMPNELEIQNTDNALMKIAIESDAGIDETYAPKIVMARPTRNGDLTIRVIDQCYYSETKKLEVETNSNIWWNLIMPPFFLVDWATGYMWEYPTKIILDPARKPVCSENSVVTFKELVK